MRGLGANPDKNLSIKQMIMLGLSFMTLLVCLVGIFGTLGQYVIRTSSERTLNKDVPALKYLNQTLALGLDMKDIAKEVDISVLSLQNNQTVTTEQLNSLKTMQVEKVNSTYKALLESLTNYTNESSDQLRANAFSESVKTAATNLFVASRYAIQTPNQATLSNMAVEERNFSNSLTTLNNLSSTLLTEKSNANIATANRVGIVILISTLLAAILSWLISSFLWRTIFSKLSKLNEATKIVEAGQSLSATEEPIASLMGSNNAFGLLAKSLLDMSTSVDQDKENLKNTVLYDTATSLPNRIALNERLNTAILKPKHNFALLLLNCDRIDKVKENYGSLVKTRLCQDIAIRLAKAIKSDNFIVHLSHEEFAILLEPIHSQEEVLDAAKRIIDAVTLPFDVDDHIIDISGNLGIVFADHSYKTIDAVMNDAEMAMQKAKDAGPGRWKVFKTSIKDDHDLHLQLVEDLAYAIENDGLELYYHSIIDLKHRSIDGFEALVRWKHPERGEIFPDTFIPIAEEHDLIYSLDLYVLKKASEQIKAWNAEFSNAHKVNINMSSQSLLHGQLLNDFEQLVETYDLKPAYLSLDINENFLVENTKHSRSVLQKLRAMGVSIILDDFGTGYSAISNLQNSQVDEVKIDRSFIQDIETQEERLNVVKTIITLAQNMSLRVIAEGVESKAQLLALQGLGCNHAQGYVFSKPKDIHGIEKLLERQRAKRAKLATLAKQGHVQQSAQNNQARQNNATQQEHRSTTDTVIEEVQIQHPVNQTIIPEMVATGAPKNLLLADSDLRQTMFD